MDITGIILIIGLVLLALGLLWFIVAVIGLILARKTARDINEAFNQDLTNRRRDFL